MKREAPSDIAQAVTVARYEVLKYLRGKKMLVVLLIMGLIFSLFLIIPPALGHDYPQDSNDFAMQFLGFAGLVIILCATFFASDALVSEFQQRTAFLILPNAIKRWVILAGKFIASVVASIIVIAIFYGSIAVIVGVIDGDVPSALASSLGLAVVYSLSIISVAYLLSSFLKSTVSSSVLTFFLFLLILPIIESVLTFSGVKPWFSLNFAGGTVTYIMQNPYPRDSTITLPPGAGGMQIAQYYPVVSISLAVMLAYTFFSLLLAYWRFNRREL